MIFAQSDIFSTGITIFYNDAPNIVVASKARQYNIGENMKRKIVYCDFLTVVEEIKIAVIALKCYDTAVRRLILHTSLLLSF